MPSFSDQVLSAISSTSTATWYVGESTTKATVTSMFAPSAYDINNAAGYELGKVAAEHLGMGVMSSCVGMAVGLVFSAAAEQARNLPTIVNVFNRELHAHLPSIAKGLEDFSSLNAILRGLFTGSLSGFIAGILREHSLSSALTASVEAAILDAVGYYFGNAVRQTGDQKAIRRFECTVNGYNVGGLVAKILLVKTGVLTGIAAAPAAAVAGGVIGGVIARESYDQHLKCMKILENFSKLEVLAEAAREFAKYVYANEELKKKFFDSFSILKEENENLFIGKFEKQSAEKSEFQVNDFYERVYEFYEKNQGLFEQCKMKSNGFSLFEKNEISTMLLLCQKCRESGINIYDSYTWHADSVNNFFDKLNGEENKFICDLISRHESNQTIDALIREDPENKKIYLQTLMLEKPEIIDKIFGGLSPKELSEALFRTNNSKKTLLEIIYEQDKMACKKLLGKLVEGKNGEIFLKDRYKDFKQIAENLEEKSIFDLFDIGGTSQDISFYNICVKIFLEQDANNKIIDDNDLKKLLDKIISNDTLFTQIDKKEEILFKILSYDRNKFKQFINPYISKFFLDDVCLNNFFKRYDIHFFIGLLEKNNIAANLIEALPNYPNILENQLFKKLSGVELFNLLIRESRKMHRSVIFELFKHQDILEKIPFENLSGEELCNLLMLQNYSKRSSVIFELFKHQDILRKIPFEKLSGKKLFNLLILQNSDGQKVIDELFNHLEILEKIPFAKLSGAKLLDLLMLRSDGQKVIDKLCNHPDILEKIPFDKLSGENFLQLLQFESSRIHQIIDKLFNYPDILADIPFDKLSDEYVEKLSELQSSKGQTIFDKLFDNLSILENMPFDELSGEKFLELLKLKGSSRQQLVIKKLLENPEILKQIPFDTLSGVKLLELLNPKDSNGQSGPHELLEHAEILKKIPFDKLSGEGLLELLKLKGRSRQQLIIYKLLENPEILEKIPFDELSGEELLELLNSNSSSGQSVFHKLLKHAEILEKMLCDNLSDEELLELLNPKDSIGQSEPHELLKHVKILKKILCDKLSSEELSKLLTTKSMNIYHLELLARRAPNVLKKIIEKISGKDIIIHLYDIFVKASFASGRSIADELLRRCPEIIINIILKINDNEESKEKINQLLEKLITEDSSYHKILNLFEENKNDASIINGLSSDDVNKFLEIIKDLPGMSESAQSPKSQPSIISSFFGLFKSAESAKNGLNKSDTSQQKIYQKKPKEIKGKSPATSTTNKPSN